MLFFSKVLGKDFSVTRKDSPIIYVVKLEKREPPEMSIFFLQQSLKCLSLTIGQARQSRQTIEMMLSH